MNRASKLIGVAVLGASVLLTACASESGHPSQIPTAATMRVEGTSNLLFTAPHDGVAYVYDSTSDKLIWSGGLIKGQALKLDTSNDQIKVDDRLVTQTTLTRNNTYRIYFNPTAVVP